ncbi:MAG: SDR family oxidoreductase [Spirochaetes bacterium]|nr:SDR family oxidoreductase [Spirochaetota bacterium]
MGYFENKRVLITGAATGIGRLMALMLADEKAELALADINSEKLETARKDCSSKGAAARAYLCDISDKNDIDGLARNVIRDFGRVDILINNAGMVKGKYVHEYEFDEIKKTMEVNFIGGAYLTRLMLPDMMKRNDGHIVNVASAMGLTPMPRMGEYVASKFAIVGFTDTLRMEMKKRGCTGVKILCVCPAGIDTGMFPGYKAPLLTPLLRPETVARETLAAIRKNKKQLKIPLIVKFIPLLRTLPPGVQDAVGRVTGLINSMDYFERKKK